MSKAKWFVMALVAIMLLGPALVACQPQVVVQTVEKIVEVEKEVEVEKVVKETVVVTEKEVVEIAITPEPEKELEGTIVISLSGNDTQTWENVAMAYEALHPKVDVRVELKPGDGYQEWIRAQFAAGTPEASYMNANVVADLLQAGKFLDLAPYFDKVSPYTNQPWREDMEDWAVDNMTDPIEGKAYVLNLETVQVLWFYNKRIFEEVGITDIPSQPTWDEFIGWCEQIKEAGYIPFAIEGDYQSFWSMRIGWMVRTYSDQYTRHEQLITRCQPDDWCFREGIDDKWEYDPTDPFNDDAKKVTFNGVRQYKALWEGDIDVNGPGWRDMYENLAQLFGPMTQPGWIGTTNAAPLFLTQQAAIWLDGAWFFTSFEKQIKSLAEGTYGGDDATPVPGAERAEVFEIGTFNFPTMTGELVDSPARSIEVNIGFWGIPKKDQAQNDLEIDFLMFMTSPQGYGIYLRNKLDANNLQGGIAGPPVVKNVSLPAMYAERFANIKFIGNQQKAGPGNWRSRGMADYQPTVRTWVDLNQQFFNGEIEIQAFLDACQKNLMDNFEEMLTEHLRWAEGLAALDSPEKQPEKIE